MDTNHRLPFYLRVNLTLLFFPHINLRQLFFCTQISNYFFSHTKLKRLFLFFVFSFLFCFCFFFFLFFFLFFFWWGGLRQLNCRSQTSDYYFFSNINLNLLFFPSHRSQTTGFPSHESQTTIFSHIRTGDLQKDRKNVKQQKNITD